MLTSSKPLHCNPFTLIQFPHQFLRFLQVHSLLQFRNQPILISLVAARQSGCKHSVYTTNPTSIAGYVKFSHLLSPVFSVFPILFPFLHGPKQFLGFFQQDITFYYLDMSTNFTTISPNNNNNSILYETHHYASRLALTLTRPINH